MTHVAAGDHRLHFSDCSGQGRFLPEWHLDARTVTKARVVKVLAEQQVQLGTTDLSRAGRIAGTVTDEATGSALADVCVSVQDRAGVQVSQRGRVRTRQLQRRGGCPRRPTASTSRCARACGAPLHPRRTSRSGTSTPARWLLPPPCRSRAASPSTGWTRVCARLARAAGSVTDTGGAGIAGVCVTGHVADGREVGLGTTDVHATSCRASSLQGSTGPVRGLRGASSLRHPLVHSTRRPPRRPGR
jgi:hypothetical protein